MKKRLWFLSLFCVGICAEGFLPKQTTRVTPYDANGDFSMTATLEEKYDKGQVVDIPTGYFGEIKAASYVNYPSGKVALTSRAKLHEHGTYVVKYIAEIAGKTYIHDESFVVRNPLLSFNGNASSSKYDENNSLTKRAGINVSLAQGETLTFNEPIDLQNYDDKHAPFYFTIMPSKEGTFDVGYMIMTLTDVYDPNNSCEIKMNLNEDPAHTCWQPALGKANHQSYKGWNYSGATPVLWVNNYGTYCEITPYNTWVSGTRTITDIFSKQRFGLWVDPNDNILYFCYFSFLANMNVSALMIDLDDGSYQDEIFGGFTTGEVYVSFRAGDYKAPSCNIQVLKVGDADLSQKYLDDVAAPRIDLEKAYDENRLGVKGRSYPVIPATIHDGYCGYLNPKINVYYDYARSEGTYYSGSTEYRKEIPIIDGRFATAQTGKYSIVYSSSDFSLNYIEKVININVFETTYPISNVVIEEDVKTSGEANNAFRLPKVLAFTGGYGETTVAYQAVCNGNHAEIFGDDINGYYFLPRLSGTYQIQVIVKDMFNEQGIVDYTFTVTEQINGAFAGEVNLPKYLVSSVDYILPRYQGENPNGQIMTANIKVQDGSGEKAITPGAKVNFTPDDDGDALITYFFGTNERSYVLPVRTVKEENIIQIERYFDTLNIDKEATDKGVKLETASEGEFIFINSLLTNAFKFEFIYDSMLSEEGRVSFALTDSIDLKQRIVFAFKISASGVDFYLNDCLVLKNFAPSLSGGESLTVQYNPITKVLYVGGNTTYVLSQNAYGEVFTGFNSKKVYLSGRLEGQISITMANIINQDLTQVSKVDNRPPSLVINGEYGTLLQSKGDIIDIHSVVAGDVLSPYSKAVVTLEYDYQTVSALDGTVLNNVQVDDYHSYRAKLDEYGQYTLTYVVTDWANRRYTYSLLFTVIDQVPPIIYLDGDMPTIAKIGTVTIPRIKVVDNENEECTLIVTVTSPETGIQYITGQTSFEAKTAGTYVLTIIAIDQSGNTTTKIYYIEVK